MPDPLRELLTFDPLAEAERITGGSIHEKGWSPTMVVGFALMQGHAAAKEDALTARGDTTFSNKIGRYISIIEGAGFEHLLRVPFRHYEDPSDALMVYGHRDGCLLSFDTFNGETVVNGGHVYYNWRPSQKWFDEGKPFITSSGGWRRVPGKDGPIDADDIYSGDHDCREALVYNLDRLSSYGEFVSPWQDRPFLWLLHHGDTKGEYDHNALNAERIAMLPVWAQEMITPRAV